MLGKEMKTIFLAWSCLVIAATASVIEDGKGFFPVIVQFVDRQSGTPIEGATVRLEDAGTYTEQEIDPDRQTKLLKESLRMPITTNGQGVAVLFYFGGWSRTTIGEKTTYSRSLAPTIIVEHDGKEVYRSSLIEWAKKNGYNADSSSAPWIVVPQPAAK